MAQKILTIFTDDITGESSDDVAPHTLTLDGATYEIDLGSDSYDTLLEKLGPFLGAARRTGGRLKPGAAGKRQPSGSDAAKVRTWARENGYQMSNRGRIPASILEVYEKAK
ncbi:Lsr2 family protein [Streptomyces sp. PA03-6a]|nr:Lsr2 family protein [Streptomyces sp. PA03-6a]